MLRLYNATLLTFDGGRELTKGELWVDGAQIAYVGPARPDAPAFEPYSFDPIESDRVMYVPAEALTYLGYQVTVSDCKKYACLIAPDGREMRVALGNVGVLVNNRIHSLERQVEEKDGVLYLPVRWFAHEAGLCCTQRDGVIYINKKHCELTPNMAAILKEALAD